MFDEIAEKYYTLIYNYCRSKLNGDKEAAEDITQEVFLILFKKQKRLKVSDNIKIWLYRTADLEIKGYIRKHPPVTPLEECPNAVLIIDECFPSLENSTLDVLTEDESRLIREYYSDEDKQHLANAQKLSIDALYLKIHRIKKKLATSLDELNNIKT